MIYEPMDPDHDRQTRVLVCMCGACNVEVQTLELILGQELFGELVLYDSEQLALKADVSQLRANWAEARWVRGAYTVSNRGLCSPMSRCIGIGRIGSE